MKSMIALTCTVVHDISCLDVSKAQSWSSTNGMLITGVLGSDGIVPILGESLDIEYIHDLVMDKWTCP